LATATAQSSPSPTQAFYTSASSAEEPESDEESSQQEADAPGPDRRLSSKDIDAAFEDIYEQVYKSSGQAADPLQRDEEETVLCTWESQSSTPSSPSMPRRRHSFSGGPSGGSRGSTASILEGNYISVVSAVCDEVEAQARAKDGNGLKRELGREPRGAGDGAFDDKTLTERQKKLPPMDRAASRVQEKIEAARKISDLLQGFHFDT